MIQANELRIGNYVLPDNDINQEHTINKEDFIQDSFNSLYPVPLTEDWLLSFGFKTVGGIYGLHTGEIEIYRTSKGTIVIDVEGQALVLDNIKNVHQLQNLFFSLTGSELVLSTVPCAIVSEQ